MLVSQASTIGLLNFKGPDFEVIVSDDEESVAEGETLPISTAVSPISIGKLPEGFENSRVVSKLEKLVNFLVIFYELILLNVVALFFEYAKYN